MKFLTFLSKYFHLKSPLNKNLMYFHRYKGLLIMLVTFTYGNKVNIRHILINFDTSLEFLFF